MRLTVGAGTGYFEPHPSRAVGPNGRVLALDVEPDMVRYLIARAAREQLANVDATRTAGRRPSTAPRRKRLRASCPRVDLPCA